MSPAIIQRHAQEFQQQGFTILRAILPPSLIADLRRQCERASEEVRRRDGPQAQRFQPVSAFDVETGPFHDYRDLPALRHAFQGILGHQTSHGNVDTMGVLLEPANLPWCTAWHRDWRDNIAGLDLDDWRQVRDEPEMFNQINAPLYEDSCTWAVPGSHRRDDSADEAALFPGPPTRAPDLNGLSSEERERRCLDYCASMPHAQRLVLDAGDVALYRSTLWHLGNYIPYRRRATLHDTPDTPRFQFWRQQAMEEARRRREAGA